MKLRYDPPPDSRPWMRADPGYDDPPEPPFTFMSVLEACIMALVIFVLIVLAAVDFR